MKKEMKKEMKKKKMPMKKKDMMMSVGAAKHTKRRG